MALVARDIPQLKAKILERQNHRCAHCGQRLGRSSVYLVPEVSKTAKAVHRDCLPALLAIKARWGHISPEGTISPKPPETEAEQMLERLRKAVAAEKGTAVISGNFGATANKHSRTSGPPLWLVRPSKEFLEKLEKCR